MFHRPNLTILLKLQPKMKRHKIDLEKISLMDGGVHLIINARINRKKMRLVLDTGASRTVMDSNRHERWQNGAAVEELNEKSAGLGTDSMQSAITIAENFKLGDLKIKNLQVVLLDLRHVNSSYAQLDIAAVDGILGGDVLERYCATIDYKKNKLILSEKRGK